jgi:MFS family permease
MADVVDDPAEREEPGHLGVSFWQVWSASSLSNLADGLVKVALPLVAVTLTDSPGLVAGVSLAVTLPWLLFALPVGALADRVDRRLAMVTADVVRAAAVAVLAVALGPRARVVGRSDLGPVRRGPAAGDRRDHL